MSIQFTNSLIKHVASSIYFFSNELSSIDNDLYYLWTLQVQTGMILHLWGPHYAMMGGEG